MAGGGGMPLSEDEAQRRGGPWLRSHSERVKNQEGSPLPCRLSLESGSPCSPVPELLSVTPMELEPAPGTPRGLPEPSTCS